MALTLGRWIAAAIGGSLLITALLLKPGEEHRRETDARWKLAARTSLTSATASIAVTHYRSDEILDSVRRALAASPARDRTSRVIVGRGFGPGSSRLIRSSVARTSALRAGLTAGSLDLVFVFDTQAVVSGMQIRGGMVSTAHLLPLAAGDRCVAVARVRPQGAWENPESVVWSESWFTSERLAARLLGPCVFYEAFGLPGTNIDRWLRSGGWRFGLYGSLTRPQQRVDLADWWMQGIPWGTQAGWPQRSYITQRGYRCVTGDADTCRSQLLVAAHEQLSRAILESRAGRIESPIRYWESRNDAYVLGQYESGLLGDMVRSLGAEKFRRFWTSNLEPADAFAAATGQDIGEWTVEWASRAYSAPGRGPGLNIPTTLGAIVMILVLLGAAIIASRQRQVA